MLKAKGKLTPKYLRTVRLHPYIVDEEQSEFVEDLRSLFDEVEEFMLEMNKKHNGNFQMSGLPGLVNAAYGKAGRTYNYVMKDSIGKGKFDDEVWDQLVFTMYLLLNLRKVLLRDDKLVHKIDTEERYGSRS